MSQVEIRFEKDESRVEELAGEHSIFHKGIEEINSSLKCFKVIMMNDIKAWITDKHHYFMGQGWIDIHSLECIEYRFKDYTVLGGNSFVEDLMRDIRSLPMHPPKE